MMRHALIEMEVQMMRHALSVVLGTLVLGISSAGAQITIDRV
jgi:hypothetical protein